MRSRCSSYAGSTDIFLLDFEGWLYTQFLVRDAVKCHVNEELELQVPAYLRGHGRMIDRISGSTHACFTAIAWLDSERGPLVTCLFRHGRGVSSGG